jgi:hypothetical protein
MKIEFIKNKTRTYSVVLDYLFFDKEKKNNWVYEFKFY